VTRPDLVLFSTDGFSTTAGACKQLDKLKSRGMDTYGFCGGGLLCFGSGLSLGGGFSLYCGLLRGGCLLRSRLLCSSGLWLGSSCLLCGGGLLHNWLLLLGLGLWGSCLWDLLSESGSTGSTYEELVGGGCSGFSMRHTLWLLKNTLLDTSLESPVEQ